MLKINDEKFLERLSELIGPDEISQHKLAKKAQLNHSTISKIISGKNKMSFDVFAKLCAALGLDPFLYLEDNGDLAFRVSRLPEDVAAQLREDFLSED